MTTIESMASKLVLMFGPSWGLELFIEPSHTYCTLLDRSLIW